MEFCVRLNVLRLFHVGHVVQNRRSAILLAWHKWFSCKGKEWKIYRCGLTLSSEPQKWKFHVVIWQTASKIAPKIVLHLQHDYFSSFSQSNHSFVALSLPSSFLKLLLISVVRLVTALNFPMYVKCKKSSLLNFTVCPKDRSFRACKLSLIFFVISWRCLSWPPLDFKPGGCFYTFLKSSVLTNTCIWLCVTYKWRVNNLRRQRKCCVTIA